MIEYVPSTPVIEHIAPAPAVTLAVPCQQSPPVYTTATVDTDVNLDSTGLVNSQFSSSAVETSAPQVIGSERPPVGQSQYNGIIKRTVGLVVGQARTLQGVIVWASVLATGLRSVHDEQVRHRQRQKDPR